MVKIMLEEKEWKIRLLDIANYGIIGLLVGRDKWKK